MFEVTIYNCTNKKTRGRIQKLVEHLRLSFFTKLVRGFQPLTIFAKTSVLEVRLGSEYASETSFEKLDEIPWKTLALDFLFSCGGGSKVAPLIKKGLFFWCFPENFGNVLITPNLRKAFLKLIINS